LADVPFIQWHGAGKAEGRYEEISHTIIVLCASGGS
jgi:hypothetical protein